MIHTNRQNIRSGRIHLASTKKATTTPEYFVRVVDAPDRLPEFVADWDELASHAIEPNPFYESWMLLPALKAYARESDVLFVFVYRRKAIQPNGPPVLVGFFPLEQKSRYKRIPIRVLKLFEHKHCFLDVPLIRDGFGTECLDALFDWANNDSLGAPVLEMGQITGEGPFANLLIDHCLTHHRLSFVDEQHTRALFRRSANADEYLAGALSTKLRKELRRQKKRLGEQGRLEYRCLENSEHLDQWLQHFRELEDRGWKGEEGTSFQATQADREFLETIGKNAFEHARLMMLGLFLDDRPIAMKLNFVSLPGSFSFKIAYDESLSKYSPGVLLEIENIIQLHQMPHIEWMDSCAVAEHSMINRLWKDRRAMQTILVSTGRAGGDLLVSSLPMLRWLRRAIRGSR